jgi:ubiquinone/menaquinone biosynthesis C-methylase UbiE
MSAAGPPQGARPPGGAARSDARGEHTSAVTNSAAAGYLLAQNALERERLRIQAEVWAPATERMLDAIGVERGWRCVDLGCGAPGALGALARRVTDGSVVGIDNDPALVAEAERWVRNQRIGNVQLHCGDAFATPLPSASFDLVHVRFMFAPLGRARELFDEIDRLLRPGGIVAIQEPDASSWRCWPPSGAFDTLVSGIVDAFAAGGGDFNAGRKSPALLEQRGYRDAGVRSEVLTLRGGHPYARLPLLFASSLSTRLERALGRETFARTKADCERACADPATTVTSFVVQQAWGRKPLASTIRAK